MDANVIETYGGVYQAGQAEDVVWALLDDGWPATEYLYIVEPDGRLYVTDADCALGFAFAIAPEEDRAAFEPAASDGGLDATAGQAPSQGRDLTGTTPPPMVIALGEWVHFNDQVLDPPVGPDDELD